MLGREIMDAPQAGGHVIGDVQVAGQLQVGTRLLTAPIPASSSRANPSQTWFPNSWARPRAASLAAMASPNLPS